MVVGEICQERDLIIIGGGPGGYTAAIRAAQLGINVTLIEKDKMGGNCLNKACIPSKLYAYTGKKKVEMRHLENLGFPKIDNFSDLTPILNYKEKITKTLQRGIQSLCKGNQIEVITGKATFLSKNRIGVENRHQFDIFEFKQAIIATGSIPKMQKGIANTQNRMFLSHEIFNLNEVPEHLIVYGNDYIALEVATTFHALGAKITILWENSELPFDRSINKEFLRIFKKKKIQWINSVSLQTVEEKDDRLILTISIGSEVSEITGTHLFISGTRLPNIKELGLERIGMEFLKEGFIKINKNLETSIPNIYAIGDVTGTPFLAVKAIKQGKVIAERLAGCNSEVDLTFLPEIAHTIPPMASVGLSEDDAKRAYKDIRTNQFSLASNGYSMITGEKDGFIKIISDAEKDIILGIHMIGDGAVELSSTFVQLLEMAAKEEDVKFPLYAHPSMNEGLLEAVEGLVGLSIHTIPKRNKKNEPIQLS